MKRKGRIVNTKEWQNMDGRETVVKMINSYLTTKFIGVQASSNECLTEAIDVQHIAKKFHADRLAAQEQIAIYLADQFLYSEMFNRIPMCLIPADHILTIVENNKE